MECGECMACCKSLPIDDIKLVKANNVICQHCDKGCRIYDDRPESCVNFNCVFIEDGYDISLRPDKTGVIFEKITTKIYLALLDEDYLDRWETPEMLRHIENYNNQGISVVISSFSTGIIDTKCTEAHDPNKVLEIVLRFKQ